MLSRKILFQSKRNFKLLLNDATRNKIFNFQAFNILQVNKVAKKLTLERRQSLERHQNKVISEIEGEPIINDEEEPKENFINRIANDKSHIEMMERFKKTVAMLEAKGSPLNKENFDKTKKDFDQNFFNKIHYVKPEKKVLVYRNMELEINSQFKIKKVEPSSREVKRTGILGYKMGMTGFWDKFGIYYPVTVLKVDRCQVVQVKTKEKEGYNAVQVGIGEKRIKKLTKSLTGHFIRANVPPKQHLREFKVDHENLLPVGYMLGVKHFIPGQLVDVRSKSKGKGTQGVMQRWNFAGGFATHGCSLKHRHGGSIGNREKPGRVFPGRKMAGQMGNEYVTIESLLVYKTDFKNSLIFIKGAVPGFIGQVVEIKDAFWKKDKQYKNLLYPTFIPEKGKTIPDVEIFSNSIDRNEVFRHANDEVLGVSDEEEEGDEEEDDEDVMEVK